MPKLENFPSIIKIDRNPYPKNGLIYEVNDDYVCIYYSNKDDKRPIKCGNAEEWTKPDNSAYTSIDELVIDLDDYLFSLPSGGIVSPENSSYDALGATGDTSNFVGDWVEADQYPSIVVAVATDQPGIYYIEFSPDGVYADSTLTRYYRVGQINIPHRFTITRKFVRVRFINSGDAQTYFRLQTILGAQTDLNAPIDSVLAKDFDALCTRPTDYRLEIALGRRQGATLWNKFGYNEDIDTGTEVLASWGGTFTPLLTATTLSIVSTDATDDIAGTGAQKLVIIGVDENRNAQTEIIDMDGLTPVVTTSQWLGINRMTIFLAGTDIMNNGTITATAVTDASIQAQIPAENGVTQQCIFFTADKHQALADWLFINTLRQAAANPKITAVGWVYSAVSNARYEVFNVGVDTAVDNTLTLSPSQAFVIGESSVFWIEITTDKANTIANGRFSLVEIEDVDL